jgi:hypothetical protein
MRALLSTAAIFAVLVPAAQAAPQKVPPSLYRVDGRPVPVSCLEALTAQEDDARKAPIDLRHCGDPTLKPKTQADGTVGYDEPQGGYFYYRYVGVSDGVDVLSLQTSGGGSGQFTQLVGVTHDGQLVRWVKDYGGGDRCNGGISDERIANGRLAFDQAITPYDLVALAKPKTKLEAYKDLDASASSCIGVSHMAGDDKHWTGVSLTDDSPNGEPDWTKRFTYQACFDRLYRATVSGGHGELDRAGVIAFAHAFEERCVLKR